jgi:hypothetical protein
MPPGRRRSQQGCGRGRPRSQQRCG